MFNSIKWKVNGRWGNDGKGRSLEDKIRRKLQGRGLRLIRDNGGNIYSRKEEFNKMGRFIIAKRWEQPKRPSLDE